MGFRTPQGRIVRTQSFNTRELPRLVRGKPHAWDPHLCMHWGDTFLNFVQEHVPNGKKAAKKQDVWRATFTPGSGVTLKLLEATEVQEVTADEDRVGFIPRWYFESIGDVDIPNDPGPP